jgi:hypothetical protein
VAIELHGTRAAVDAHLEPMGFQFQRLTRGSYLRHAAGFAIRHPAAAVRLWRAYRDSSRYSGAGKLLRGIDIAASRTLAVGVYVRRGARRPGS